MESIGTAIRNTIYKIGSIINPKLPNVIILCYHSIGNDAWRFTVEKDTFIKQINYLLEKYEPASFYSVLDIINGSQTPAKPIFILSFDDGYADIMSVKEFLKEKGIKPILFLLASKEGVDVTQLGNSKKFLSKEEVMSLVADGWMLGSHGISHKDFWAMSQDEISAEVKGSKDILEKEFNIEIRAFSYPRGRYSLDIIKAVRDSGYDLAVSMDDAIIGPRIDSLLLPRVGIDKTHDPEIFKETIMCQNIKIRQFIKNLGGGIFRKYL